jgi:hypothetical protein
MNQALYEHMNNKRKMKKKKKEKKIYVRASRVVQVLERLPSKCEALSSNPNNCQKNKTKAKFML